VAIIGAIGLYVHRILSLNVYIYVWYVYLFQLDHQMLVSIMVYGKCVQIRTCLGNIVNGVFLVYLCSSVSE
jgi:hypothetical protein